MILDGGNRIYRCNGCGKEIYVSNLIAGVPHCERGTYDFKGIKKDNL